MFDNFDILFYKNNVEIDVPQVLPVSVSQYYFRKVRTSLWSLLLGPRDTRRTSRTGVGRRLCLCSGWVFLCRDNIYARYRLITDLDRGSDYVILVASSVEIEILHWVVQIHWKTWPLLDCSLWKEIRCGSFPLLTLMIFLALAMVRKTGHPPT